MSIEKFDKDLSTMLYCFLERMNMLYCIGVIVDSSGKVINCASIMKVFKRLLAWNRKFEGFSYFAVKEMKHVSGT